MFVILKAMYRMQKILLIIGVIYHSAIRKAKNDSRFQKNDFKPQPPYFRSDALPFEIQNIKPSHF